MENIKNIVVLSPDNEPVAIIYGDRVVEKGGYRVVFNIDDY